MGWGKWRLLGDIPWSVGTVFSKGRRFTMNRKEMSKCVNWFNNAYKSITESGGSPSVVLDAMPEDMLYTLVVNDIHLVYFKCEEEDML